ncbi:MAG: phosphodiester glycosidase family protein [Chloroflexi bacterium]|nr:phosphodiester glycosidase family protein [Chloroflexota bacterium]
MARHVALFRLSSILFAASLLVGCNLPTNLLPTLTALPEPAEKPRSDWLALADGLQWRKLLPDGDELAQMIVVRINPQKYRFRAIYRPGQPLSLSGWRKLEADANLIVNANFFDTAYKALGLVVSDGASHGSAYRDRGGTFLIRNGEAAVVASRADSLQSKEEIEQAVQGFPLLVEQGRQAYFSTTGGERTRRTLIGIDKNGNLLIIVAPFLGLPLADLSAYLPKTDLDIDTAINLDGGGSTMIAIPGADYHLPSLDPVPAILAIYPRSTGWQ